MKNINEPSVQLKTYLNEKDHALIAALEQECIQFDGMALKLELDYKRGVALCGTGNDEGQEINEFLCFDGQQLIGYIGICGFGGAGAKLEINGMVHPAYRRRGVFTKLHALAMEECKKRNSGGVLLLCDHASASGLNFLKKVRAEYEVSEVEMCLDDELFSAAQESARDVALRKAKNSDAREIARQNAIYFNAVEEASQENDASSIMPEDEEKRGMTVYLAEACGQVVGKVHLQTNAAVSGIYGLGVLPEHRKKGYGRAILLSAVRRLKESNTSAILLQVAAENATALNLYKSCGFKETSVMDYFCLKV